MARGEGLEPSTSALIADVLPIGLSTKNKEHLYAINYFTN